MAAATSSQIKNGQQPLPAIALRARRGVDIGERQNLRIADMMRQHRLVGIGQGTIVEQHYPTTLQLRMKRLYRDQIGQQDRSPDHRKQDDAIVERHDRRRVQNMPYRAAMLPRADLAAKCRQVIRDHHRKRLKQ
jgi:hypothetical protein